MPLDSSELRRAGLKVTVPRVKIYEILESGGEGDHFSAEDIYRTLLDQGEDVGLATVYRVLTQFEAAGLISRHHFEGGHSVFELMRDDQHDHVVCVRCGKVREFSDNSINDRLADIGHELGFEVNDRTVYLYGTCINGCEEG